MDKRIAYIQIKSPTGDKEIKNIGLRFRVNRKLSQVGSTANVSIANLPQEDIEYLSTISSPWFKQKEKKQINIFAGYESTGVAQIFSGDIFSAIPEGMPDTWLNIEAKTNFHNQQNIINYKAENMKVKEVAESIAKTTGLELIWEATSEKIIDSINLNGAKSKLLNKLNELDNFTAFIDNGYLRVVDQNAEPPIEHSRQSATVSNGLPTSNKKQSGYIKLINADTGLIGIPQPDEYGIKVKILLDPYVQLSDWFKLESKQFPLLNGVYQIYEISIDGATREPQYYMELSGKVQKVNV